MRLAILSDIHGNRHALEAVLQDIARQGTDEVIVSGDMVNRGPNNIAVLEILSERGYPLLLGNHDDLVRKWVDRDADLPSAWFDDPFWLGTAWTVAQLQEAAWVDLLRGLPMTHRVEIPDAPALLISHGSPRHYREGYGQYLSDEDISEIVQMYPADILIGSHTHRQMARRWAQYRIYNTGAVGVPFNGDPRAQYLLMTLENNDWQVEFRAVAYDHAAALEAYEALGYLPDGGLSAEIFREELRYARSFYAPFWMWTEGERKPRTPEAWQAYRRAFPERFSLAAQE